MFHQTRSLLVQLTTMSTTVLVTGSSGFIAQHIVKLLISKGYAVVGTVRLATKGEKLRANCDLISAGKFQYTIVADIGTENAFDHVFSDYPQISIVLHTASPFFYDTTDPEKDLVLPAIHGTTNIMKAIEKEVNGGNGTIKRVVITSSDAALYSADDEQNAKLSFDESSWNDISYADAIKDPINAYYGAKSFAEKIAWESSKTPGFPPLVSVNPVYVFGPQAYENEVSDTLNTSNELIHGLLKLGPEGKFDNDKGGFVDVRDVAKAHLAALEEDKLVGKRLYMTNGKFSVQMLLDIVNSKIPSFKGKVPTGNPGSGPDDISTMAKTSNAATRQLLGIEWVSLTDCVIDVVDQIIRFRESRL